MPNLRSRKNRTVRNTKGHLHNEKGRFTPVKKLNQRGRWHMTATGKYTKKNRRA